MNLDNIRARLALWFLDMALAVAPRGVRGFGEHVAAAAKALA